MTEYTSANVSEGDCWTISSAVAPASKAATRYRADAGGRPTADNAEFRLLFDKWRLFLFPAQLTQTHRADYSRKMLPHGRDQADTAVRVSARAAGVTLRRSAHPGSIAAAVRQVLENSLYRAAAERLGEAIRRDAASDLLVRELEAVAAKSCRERPATGRRIS